MAPWRTPRQLRKKEYILCFQKKSVRQGLRFQKCPIRTQFPPLTAFGDFSRQALIDFRNPAGIIDHARGSTSLKYYHEKYMNSWYMQIRSMISIILFNVYQIEINESELVIQRIFLVLTSDDICSVWEYQAHLYKVWYRLQIKPEWFSQ